MLEFAPLAVGAADLALGTEALVGPGVRLSVTPPRARFSLRARDPATLADLLGRPVPKRIGEMQDGIACLGPDEWLAILPAGTELPFGQDLPVSVVDVSARAVGLCAEGAGAAALVASGCPLDIARFALGRVTRTVFETVEIVLWRESETRFHIDVWRSFAPWLWHALAAAMPARG